MSPKLKLKLISIAKLLLGKRYNLLKNLYLQKNSLFKVSSKSINNSEFSGDINFADYSSISGWLVAKKGTPYKNIDLFVDRVAVATFKKEVFRADIAQTFGYSGACGFEFQIERRDYRPRSYLLEIKQRESGKLIHSTQILFKPRKKFSLSAFITSKNRLYSKSNFKGGSKCINIVVPIYAGEKETLDCLRSVITAKTNIAYQLTIINDCSPEPDLITKVKDLVEAHRNISLIENEQNLGFVKSVNKGMRQACDSDALLLNSDAEVSDYWLDKIHAAAYSSKNIATVTPLSNNATICSFPIFNPSVDYREPSDIKTINHLLEKYNSKITIEVPTAHGFCMFIKAEVLNTVGLFDEKKWGRGYAEENDFSLKAIKAGYINVAACDTYVRHVGSVSFGSSTQERVAHNLRKLNRMYPEYLPTVSEFIKQDPLADVRREPLVELLKLQRGKDKAVLHVTHSLGGGTEYAMQTMMRRVVKNQHVNYVLRATHGGAVWEIENYPKTISIKFNILEDKNSCIDVLKQLNISIVHFHQILEFDNSIMALPNQLSVKYVISLHDYYLICPRVNLLQEKGKFCGGPEKRKCISCIAKNGCHPASNTQLHGPREYDDYRENSRKLLERASQLIAPTRGVANIFKNVYVGNNVTVKAHPEKRISRQVRKSSMGAVINVAVIGAIAEHKGALLLKQLLQFAKSNSYPIKFVLFGYANEIISARTFSNLKITGKFEHSSLGNLIEVFDCDRALFLSPWPETFSYTLSEAYQYGLFPVALSIGAFQDRISQVGVGDLISTNASLEEICNRLIQKLPKDVVYQTGKQYNNFIEEYYEV